MESATGFEDRKNLNDFLEEAELQQYYELFRDILKVTKVSQLKFVLTEDLVQIGLSRPEQRRYKKIYSKYFPNPYISKIRKMLKSNKKSDQNIHGHSSIPLETQPFFENNVKVPTKHIISIEDITINKELGMGQFGVVQQGTWTTGNQRLQVAIKCLGHERMTSNSTEFLKEAAVMHSIEHPNIVRLYGVVLHMDSLMLVTELAPLRSLLECLREVSLRQNFPVPNLCEFAEQICDGMTYLESKRLIHRDLAARNILVFSKDRVKISDFGLSRALGVGKDYYQTNYNVNLKLPVAWCAPECILFLRFTSASDVWAFGVCLWEMFTYGFQPWAAFSGQQILEAIDAPNFQRLERPECCPEAYYTTMLECWAHDFNNRPKFKDLAPKLRSIRPEQVEATVNFQKPEDVRRNSFLEYKAGQIITVLGKENMTKSPLWYGVLPGGACGMLDPTHTKPYVPPERNVCYGSLSPHPVRQSARSIRSTLLRSDVKRHTFTGKRSLQRCMISSPQGDVKHTGHVGLDGAYFGDISFLDPAGCPPRQIVTPYKPSEDLEQMPLINPNSPSHLTGASGTTPYPMLASHQPDNRPDCDEVDLACDKTRSLRKNNHRTLSEPTTSKSILSKVRSATLGRSHKGDNGTVAKTDEVHEYHEISDTDTEGTATSCGRSDRLNPKSDNVEILKSTSDFGQSLLDEIESMFKNMDRRRDDNQPGRSSDSNRSTSPSDTPDSAMTLTKAERKKGFSTGTMKPMSAHDEKTLNTAVALANEITAKSMSDLDGDKKLPHSPSERSKFHFKFPLSLHHGHAHEPDKDMSAARERRNFSEEANSVPDIQSTITEESKMAYTSLIEEPTPSTSLMTHIVKESSSILNPATIPKPARSSHVQFRSLQANSPHKARTHSAGEPAHSESAHGNVLPLPPRTTKPKLVDKPRHIRKYPLKLLDKPKPEDEPPNETKSVILYQNTKNPEVKEDKAAEVTETVQDEVDSAPKVDTNPFNVAGPSNPFACFYDNDDESDVGLPVNSESESDSGDETNNALVKDCKDHVSVEDLLEFADQKPCGRQRGVESDEVRIMCKVLKQQINVLPLPPRASRVSQPRQARQANPQATIAPANVRQNVKAKIQEPREAMVNYAEIDHGATASGSGTHTDEARPSADFDKQKQPFLDTDSDSDSDAISNILHEVRLPSSPRVNMLGLAKPMGEPRKQPINVLPLPPRASTLKKPDRPTARKPLLSLNNAVQEICRRTKKVVLKDASTQHDMNIFDPAVPSTSGYRAGPSKAGSSKAGPSKAGPSRAGPSGVRTQVRKENLGWQDVDDTDSDENRDQLGQGNKRRRPKKQPSLLQPSQLQPLVVCLPTNRGINAPEVRMMCQLHKDRISPVECLRALDLCGWSLVTATKIIKIMITVGPEVSLECCYEALKVNNGNIHKAIAMFVDE